MIRLPIDSHLPRITASLAEHRSLVLCAPPGSGKTTRVPPALIEGSARGDPSALILLQPRRVAARAAAARIAAEHGWVLGGDEVGYQVRFEKRLSRATRLRIMTEGILTRQLTLDPYLDGIGTVILDEFHERSLHTDLAIGYLRELQETVREDLRLVVMSATLESEPIARFLGDCPIIEVPGSPYPITIEHQPPGPHVSLAQTTAVAIQRMLERESGDVLVFLPGAGEIRQVARLVRETAARQDTRLLTLHGSLPAREQDEALLPCRQRKLVLATNVAETSLTIEGVRVVIDTGLARVASCDWSSGVDRLRLQRISRSSATQRAGRAGRTAPGICVRLYSQRDEQAMPAQETAEIHRIDLSGALLALHAWGYGDPASFGWFERPGAAALDAGTKILRELEAIDDQGRLRSTGRELLRFSTSPRVGALLLAGKRFHCLPDAATLAALVMEKDLRIRPAVGHESNPTDQDGLRDRFDALDQAERASFAARLRDTGIDPAAARAIARTRDELVRQAGGGRQFATLENDLDLERLARAALSAFPDRVVKRSAGAMGTGQMVGGQGLVIDPDAGGGDRLLVLAIDVEERRDRSRGRNRRARLVVPLKLEWLEAQLPGWLRRQVDHFYDEATGRVLSRRRVWFADLVVSEDVGRPEDRALAGRTLWQALRGDPEAWIEGHPRARAWLYRMRLLKSVMPEVTWPDDEQALLDQVLEAACLNATQRDAVRSADVAGLLRAYAGTAASQAIDRHAPESLAVPSGSQIRLTYRADGGPPRLSVRVQELYGWSETPRVAAGRVAVQLELLGPHFRPVQITDDLASFWRNTYPQVRKDLRARYPRHAWPDDPRTAAAEAKGGRRSL